MKIPTLTKNGRCLYAGVDDRRQVRILVGTAAMVTCGSKGRQTGVHQLKIFGLLEKLGILRIRAGPAAFDQVNS